jgi:hypothetical protein
MNDLYTLFDVFDVDQVIRTDNIYFCCDNDMLIDELNGLMLCVICGNCLNHMLVQDSYADNVTIITKSIYKPLNHLLHKIKEITGNIIPEQNLLWRHYFTDQTIDNIYDIRSILKQNNQTKLNKYSYYFYEQLTNIKLFTISQNIKESMIKQFMKKNKKFRKLKTNYQRKNLLNFHYMLHKLLSEHNINTSEKLFLPKLQLTIINHNKCWENL